VQQAQLLVNEQLETLAWMQQAAKEVAALRTQRPTTARPTASLFSLVDSSMAQSALAKVAKRIEPNGEQEVRINFEQVNFSELIRWLGMLQQQYHLQVQVATLEKINTNDMVKVQLTVKEASS
jgi:general secretion pathway protein M